MFGVFNFDDRDAMVLNAHSEDILNSPKHLTPHTCVADTFTKLMPCHCKEKFSVSDFLITAAICRHLLYLDLCRAEAKLSAFMFELCNILALEEFPGVV